MNFSILQPSVFGIVLATLLLLPGQNVVAAPPPSVEKPKLVIAVGGQQSMVYLPLNVAWRLGTFREEGLDVDIQNLAGGSQALQALLGGSADVVSGYYDHVIQMQARGEKLRAVVLQQRYPGLVLITSRQAAAVKTAADLKGRKIGVSAMGSSSHFFVNHVLGKAGLKPSDFSVMNVGVGSTAVAAIKANQIDALSTMEPSLSILQQNGDIGAILADTRTQAGTTEVFGGPYPAAAVYLKDSFVKKNPRTVQAVVNAMVRALDWLQKHSPEEVTDLMPPEFMQGNRASYVKSVRNMMESYSPDGRIDLAAVTNLVRVVGSGSAGKAPALSVVDTCDSQFVEAYWKNRKESR